MNGNNTGAVEIDENSGAPISSWQSSWYGENSYGCTALLGGDAGVACAVSALADDNCQEAVCDSPCGDAGGNGYGDCQDTATSDGGACLAIDTTANNVCNPLDNVAAIANCYPTNQQSASAYDLSFTFIANLMCGTPAPADAGAADAAASDAGGPTDAATSG